MKLTATAYTDRINGILDLVNDGKLPAQMGILAASLENSRPDPTPDLESGKLTSADIRDRLAEVCDLSLNEIAEVMTALGYCITSTRYRAASQRCAAVFSLTKY